MINLHLYLLGPKVCGNLSHTILLPSPLEIRLAQHTAARSLRRYCICGGVEAVGAKVEEEEEKPDEERRCQGAKAWIWRDRMMEWYVRVYIYMQLHTHFVFIRVCICDACINCSWAAFQVCMHLPFPLAWCKNAWYMMILGYVLG